VKQINLKEIFMKKLAIIVSSLLILFAASCSLPTADFDASATIDENITDRALSTSKTPGQNFDLSGFKLQTPIASGDGILEISSSALATYTSTYFYTHSSIGTMVFYVKDNGATTSGSSYPRCELRKTSEWKMSSSTPHTLSATLAVTDQGAGKLIVGQIHGHSTGSEALKIWWDSGSIKVGYKTTIGASEVKTTLKSGVAVGKKFSYKIASSGYKTVVTVTIDGTSYTKTINYSSSSWSNESVYFKAGNYLQDGDSSGNSAKVGFYALTAN